MADEFKVGDVVVCVDASPCKKCPYPGAPFGISLNSTWRVCAVWIDQDDVSPVIAISGVENYGTENGEEWEGYDPNRFKHLPKADDTFIDHMRSLKPSRTKEAMA